MERLGSRLSLRLEEEIALRSNRILSALMEQEQEETQPLGVEEVCVCVCLYVCVCVWRGRGGDWGGDGMHFRRIDYLSTRIVG